MWGNLWTETSYQLNFNIGFSSLRSDVLIHLTQWQYWWWFWFSLVWSFYYFLILRVARFRALKMRPKIPTSYRPHGKWGDFLACIIPLIWCINILTNSNLILRLIEWQNESSLFTVRVRSRQWYWIYKFELKNFTDILSTPKNVGNNRWQINTYGELQIADDYIHILQLRSQNKWVKNYWGKSLQDSAKTNKHNIVSAQEQLRVNFNSKLYHLNNNKNIFKNNLNISTNISTDKIELINSIKALKSGNITNSKKLWSSQKNNFIHNDISYNLHKSQFDFSENQFFNTFIIKFYKNNFIKIINHEDTDEYTRVLKRSQGTVLPIRLIKYPLNQYDTTNNKNLNLFRIRFNDSTSDLQHKQTQETIYLTLKQKRYNRKKVILPKCKIIDNNKIMIESFLNKEKTFENSIYNSTIQYKLIKKNKVRGELIPVTLAKRLLRTKKVLVLPAHVNITVITNSYDIVHSWFLPGLGIKLDCVPGRSTHHTFFIDNVGFYYGQCAEICGRYHHHMPIKLCALPFEHFLIWWNTFGLPKMLNTNQKKNFENRYSNRKYAW